VHDARAHAIRARRPRAAAVAAFITMLLAAAPAHAQVVGGNFTPQPKPEPSPVDLAIAAGNRIATLPYTYGGGHGSFVASGYDCSGSVSYVLHGAGLLSTPMDSSQLMAYGEPGPGRRITIYANPGHAFMVIDGRRFDTSGRDATGSRWQPSMRGTAGYVVRHPAGL
jgi:cell wall-associated NlpC family hydrolase